jgi:hypothetical protein
MKNNTIQPLTHEQYFELLLRKDIFLALTKANKKEDSHDKMIYLIASYFLSLSKELSFYALPIHIPGTAPEETAYNFDKFKFPNVNVNIIINTDLIDLNPFPNIDILNHNGMRVFLGQEIPLRKGQAY